MTGRGLGPDDIASRADLAEALTRLRESAGLSVRELARRVGAPSGTLGDYLSGRHLPSAAAIPTVRRALQQCGIADPAELESWLDAIRRVRSTTDRRVVRLPPPPAPYRGLAAFEPDDAELFFGRDTETETILSLLRRLRIEPGPSRGVVVVIGPSGAGKSSVLRAGVAAAVRGGALGQPGRCAVTTPGAHPAAAFATAIRALGEGADAEGPSGVIVLDQFEEVFTLAERAERDALVAALDNRDPGILLVLGMRADFYSSAAREPALLPALQHAQILVGPMSEQALRSAILEPARKVGAHVEDGLADVVLAELVPRGAASQGVGVLPLLSHALLATWQRSSRNRLTVADYRDAGGIDAAVQRSAEQVYAQLGDAEQELARRAFLRMVAIDDVAVTRRRVTRDELAQLGDDPDRVRAVVDQFVAGRLLTAGESTVEISHEALLSAWPRLRDWVGADRDGLRIHRRLTDAADAWVAADHDELLVLRGARLEVTSEWAATHGGELTRPERAFLDASIRRAELDSRAELRRTRRRRQLVAVFAVLTLVATAFAVYGLRAQASAMRQERAAAQARDEALSRQVAIESVRLRHTDPALAAQLALAAYRRAPTRDARSALIDGLALPTATRLVGPDGPTASVAVDPSGTLLATTAADGRIHLWTLHPVGPPTSEAAIQPDDASATLFTVAFSPDGRTLAASGMSRTVQLWDVTDPAHPTSLGRALSGPGNSVYGVAFSPDGSQLAAASADGSVYRWDVRDRNAPTALPTLTDLGGYVYSVAFDPDGTRLAAGSDTSVSTWDLSGSRPRRIASLPSPDGSPVRTVAISPDGRTVAAGTKDGAVVEYPIDGTATGRPSATLPGFTSWVNSITFGPDGTTLAAGSSDGTARVWSAATHTLLRTLTGSDPVTEVAYLGRTELVTQLNSGVTLLHPLRAPGLSGARDTIDELGYSANGTRLVVAPAHDDPHVELWDTSGTVPQLLTRALAPPGSLVGSGAALPSPDGRLVAAGTSTGQVLLWDVSAPRQPRLVAQLGGSSASVETVAFSPDSDILAAAGDDRQVRMWDVHDPAHPVALPPLGGFGNYVMNINFSPDGRLLAAGAADGTVSLWRVTDPAHPHQLAVLHASPSYIYSVAFNPDNRLLAVGGADRLVRLFDVSDPSRPQLVGRPLTGPTDYVFNVAFSRGGRLLAASSQDGSVWVWRVTPRNVAPRPQPIATLEAAGSDAVLGLAFDPRTGVLAAGGTDRVVRLWDLDIASDARAVCENSGTPITRAEWREYVPGTPYDPPCR